MESREGIERLLYAYSDTIDRGDFESTAQLFGDDGFRQRFFIVVLSELAMDMVRASAGWSTWGAGGTP